MMKIMKVVSLLLLLAAGGWCGCPPSTTTSPCTCREEMPGRTLDCAKVTSGTQLATLMKNEMGDRHFDFFQVIPSSGSAALDSLPANTFADKTVTHVWIGDNKIASVDAEAFTGRLGERLLEVLLGASPALTSFPYSSLAALPLFWNLHIKSSGLTAVTSFGAAPALSQIKLTNAKISSIDSGAFGDLLSLASVDLGGNADLKKLGAGAMKASTKQPWSLYLDDCSISSVSDTTFSGTLPLGVEMSGNAMTTLSEGAFGAVVANMVKVAKAGHPVTGVNLSGNPIVCDCALAWATTDAAKMALVKNAVCSNADVSGTALEDLTADFFATC